MLLKGAAAARAICNIVAAARVGNVQPVAVGVEENSRFLQQPVVADGNRVLPAAVVTSHNVRGVHSVDQAIDQVAGVVGWCG